MKANTYLFWGLAIVVLSSLVLTGCKKEEKLEDNDTQASSDHSLAEGTYTDVDNMADEAGNNTNLSSFKMQHPNAGLSVLSACAVITRDTVANPHTITIDFGMNNCACADGKNRRGKVLISYTGKYRDAGTVISIGFDNYFVNDNQVTGSKTITNNGANGAGHLSYAIHVDGNIILAHNGGTITWKSDRVREWTEGSATPERADDVYSITGKGNGVNARGISYTAEIVNPLIKKLAPGCKHFVSGTVILTPSGKKARTIDFGSGSCDDEATVTVNGHTRTITLK